jgi:ABC-type Fe3+-hydroxamate transport system substrate-binding protein
MLKFLPLTLGLAALMPLAGCEDEASVQVRAPRAEVVAAPVQEVVVAQPRVQQVVIAQPQPQVVVAQQPVVEEVVVPVEHIRRAPVVMYNGTRVYWHANRWYYQNGGRWTYYNNEPVELRSRRYVVAY